MSSLRVAFLWHMHQPWYVWPGTREAALPFVRLHGYAGYYDMPWLLRDFDQTRVTFNMVPSLVEQMGRYAAGDMTDRALDLCRRHAAELEPDDQRYLLELFSSAHPDAMPELSPRYAQLLHKRGLYRNADDLDTARRRFDEQDLRDLQVWMNLASCGYELSREAPIVRELKSRDRGFTEDDKHALLHELREALGQLTGLYREMQDAGRAEISTSPYYHPIVPLLGDMRDAMRRIPREDLPEVLWHAPEEARRHLVRARDHHREHFGRDPEGIWPSEGSVSDGALALMEECGFHWAASDEEILAHSLGRERRPSPKDLYQPYGVGDGDLGIVFRDHVLSDRIGFVYRDWAPRDAAADFVGRLLGISSSVRDLNRPGLVCVMLDGENAWGTYPDGGEGFLRAIYQAIEDEPDMETTTPGEYLKEFPPDERLSSVFPGSWIDHSFRTWIGGAEHKQAWDLLHGALQAHQTAEPGPQADEAEEYLMAAEGSDWFWWYSESHHDELEHMFDQLFRANIAAVYRVLGLDEPTELAQAITVLGQGILAQHPSGFMEATLDGRVSTYFEWQAAGLLRTSTLASAMHRSDCLIREIRFGFGHRDLWLRVDSSGRANMALSDCDVVFTFPGRADRSLRLSVREEGGLIEVEGELAEAASAAADQVVEAGVHLDALGVVRGGTLNFAVSVESGGRQLERWPQRGYLSVEVPTDDAVTSSWIV